MQSYSSLFQVLNKSIEEQQRSLNNMSPKEMYEPMSYIIGLGGKRVRPLLTLVGCDIFDVNPTNAIHAALAVELFHNFSLIHDDILDNAPLRRGNTTVHEKWNHNIALLSGDGMLVKAYDILALSKPLYIAQLLKLFYAVNRYRYPHNPTFPSPGRKTWRTQLPPHSGCYQESFRRFHVGCG